MSVIFYHSPMSSASPVHWTLEELGIPYDKVLVDLKAGDQKQDKFVALNPNAKVPVLVHEGVPIFESAAIQMYLGETFGVQKGLYPAAGPRRGEAMKWIVWTNVTLGEALSRVGRNLGDWAPEEEKNAKAGERAKAEVEALIDLVEGALAGKEYLVENRFTLADLHVISWLEYVQHFGFDLKKRPGIAAWMARGAARPAHDRAP